VKHSLALLLCCSVAIGAAEENGIVGITVDRDFTVVRVVIPGGPAAEAGVRVGDEIIAVDGYPTAKMQNVEDFLKRVWGAVGSETDFELCHPDSNRPFHIRVRRVPRGRPHEPDFRGDFSPERPREHATI
jgi:C-terminal processing protease CtpA/Prc